MPSLRLAAILLTATVLLFGEVELCAQTAQFNDGWRRTAAGWENKAQWQAEKTKRNEPPPVHPLGITFWLFTAALAARLLEPEASLVAATRSGVSFHLIRSRSRSRQTLEEAR